MGGLQGSEIGSSCNSWMLVLPEVAQWLLRHKVGLAGIANFSCKMLTGIGERIQGGHQRDRYDSREEREGPDMAGNSHKTCRS